MVKVTNPTKAPITDFPIFEAQYDPYGEVMIDDQGNYMRTERTLTWSLAPGESLDFPDYVAKVLKGIYDFLEVGEQSETPKESSDTPKQETAGKLNCRGCGMSFEGARGLALHIAARHPELL